MKIKYMTIEDFYDGVYRLVVKGLTFEARYDNLEIILTGGY